MRQEIFEFSTVMSFHKRLRRQRNKIYEHPAIFSRLETVGLRFAHFEFAELSFYKSIHFAIKTENQ